jgi:hypothetical protein
MARVVSAVIAVLLLGLYAYAVSRVYKAPRDVPSEPIVTILSLVGALVSALVVSVLAITPTLANPARALVSSGEGTVLTAVMVVAGCYLLVWLACGVALLIRWMQVPDATPILSASAKTWLGLAIAAAYSYLGLKH